MYDYSITLPFENTRQIDTILTKKLTFSHNFKNVKINYGII